MDSGVEGQAKIAGLPQPNVSDTSTPLSAAVVSVKFSSTIGLLRQALLVHGDIVWHIVAILHYVEALQK